MSLMRVPDGVSPNLKPLRDIDQHEVLNMFAHESGNINKGTVVKVNSATGRTDVMRSSSGVPYLRGTRDASRDLLPSYVYAMNYEVAWKVTNATSGDQPLGITLRDIRVNDEWGDELYFKRTKLAEGDIVVSGESVPILTRGLINTNSFSTLADPAPGLAVYPSASEAGKLDCMAEDQTRTDRVGKCLTLKDLDGFALVKVEL